MDKKVKKRIQVLNKKLATLRQRLRGTRLQTDDPSDVAPLEREIAETEAELNRLKEN